MPPNHRFTTGERIRYSGTYNVLHPAHRLPAEVTLLEGEAFPRCLKCSEVVEFELLREVPGISEDSAFRVVLFGLPPIEDFEVEPGVDSPSSEPATQNQIVQPDSQTADIADDYAPNPNSSYGRSAAFRRLSDLHEKPQADQVFRPGEYVPDYGVYSVEHDSHRLLHQATLAKGAKFPKCRTCGAEVRFRLVRAVERGSIPHSSTSYIFEETTRPEEQQDSDQPPAKIS